MGKPATLAALVIATLAFGLPAEAAQAVYDLDTSSGGLFGAELDCTQIIKQFNSEDCTYGAARLSETGDAWQGPASNGGFFAKAGTGSAVTYDANIIANNKLYEITVPFLVGSTVTVDDFDNHVCDTNDKISATWIFGPAAHNVVTNNGRSAVEAWDRVTQVMAPTQVSRATPNAASGCDYEISTPPAGVVGAPSFPPRICADADPTDCYPTPNAPSGLGDDKFWAGAAFTAGPYRTRTTGIELAPGMGANIAAGTTGTIDNWTCVASNPGSGDCIATAVSGPSGILWGTNPSGGATPSNQAKAPGFSNVVLKFSTDNSGAQTKITGGFAYYTRELRINNGTSPLGDNSWQGGAFSFSGTGPYVNGPPTARDDGPYIVKFDTMDNPLNILANDTGFTDPVTVSIVTAPVHGTVTIMNSPGAKAGIAVTYTPQAGFTGDDPFDYQIDDDAAASGTAHVSITVLDKIPVALPGDAGTTFGGAPVAKDVTSIAGVNLGDAPSTVSLNSAGDSNATCGLAGTIVTVTPVSATFTGTASCGYTITDTDGESASSVINANAIGRQPIAVDDTASTVVNTPTAPIDVLKNDTLGNGTAAENVISLLKANDPRGGALDGTCKIVDQKIVYTPDSKFSGEDSCQYVLTDSVNLTSIATVRIAIDVALPGGGSSLDALSLGALLAGSPIVARRRRRS